MAKKYIDAEKLERHFENCICEAYNTNGVTEDFEIALKATKNQPSADVQEVKHGHWIKTDDFTTVEQYAIYKYKCSECGAHVDYGIDNYCYHCGAKMDGDENG